MGDSEISQSNCLNLGNKFIRNQLIDDSDSGLKLSWWEAKSYDLAHCLDYTSSSRWFSGLKLSWNVAFSWPLWSTVFYAFNSSLNMNSIYVNVLQVFFKFHLHRPNLKWNIIENIKNLVSMLQMGSHNINKQI